MKRNDYCYPAPPGDVDYNQEEYRWNQYVARDSPPRNPTEDYPRHDEERRRVDSSYRRRARSRSRSPIRRSRDEDCRNYRDVSPIRRRDNYERSDDRRRSPCYRSRDSYDRSRKSTTITIRYVPLSIQESDIQAILEEEQINYVGLRIQKERGIKGSTDRVCGIEFEDSRQAIQWIADHQGVLSIGRDKMPMLYDHQPESRDSYQRRRDRDRSDDDYRRRRLGTPTDTMIVKGMDRNTDESDVRKSFEYITVFPIQDIRLVKDKLGKSRGFCFVQWKTVEDCSQVIEYLLSAKPRFHIQGKHVELDYSTPQGTSRWSSSKTTSTPKSTATATLAVQAAYWSRGDQVEPPPTPKATPVTKPPSIQTPATPSSTTATKSTTKPTPAMSQPASKALASFQPGTFPTPDTANFQYDSTSGYYYDPQTGLYYDANSRYFYNNQTQHYMYWDEAKKNYIAVSAENQAKQMAASDKKAKEQKEKETKKKAAKRIAKDMERWAKAQNKKKEEIKKLMEEPDPVPVNNVSAVESKKESSTADTVFSILSKQSAESERLQAINAAYTPEQLFKKPDVPTPARKTNPSASSDGGLVAYMKSSDSEEDEDDDDDESKLIDLEKMICLLCRRSFQTQDMLKKHCQLSNLHKQNLEVRRSSKVGSLTKKPAAASTSQVKYRDRAAERRSKFGVEKFEARKSISRNEIPVPYEQPTKNGLDDTNIGNQMLQKMGWKQGSGLGKTLSGRTDPITVQQRSRGAGLGMRGSSYGLDGSESGDYREVAKKVTMARYFEGS